MLKYFQFRDFGKRLEYLETPVPIIDIDVVARNVSRWQARCDGLRLGNRPNIKSHKLVGLAKYQLAMGPKVSL